MLCTNFGQTTAPVDSNGLRYLIAFTNSGGFPWISVDTGGFILVDSSGFRLIHYGGFRWIHSGGLLWIPVDSLLWIPVDSNAFHRIHVDSHEFRFIHFGGFRWIPVDSGGFPWGGLRGGSGGFQWNVFNTFR